MPPPRVEPALVRRSLLRAVLAVVVGAVVLPVGSARAVVPGLLELSDPTGLIASPNVTVLGTLPETGGISARIRDDVLYVSGLDGLSTYDVSDPAVPRLLGVLPLPHFQNEDVDLGGDILLISNDAAESTGILHVIDISDPAQPSLLSSFPMGGNPLAGGPGHTASCVLECRYAWVTDGGGIRIIDLTDPADPVDRGHHDTPAGGGVATHDVQEDGDGHQWVVGFGGAAAYRLGPDYAGDDLGTLVAVTDEDGHSTYFDELGLGDGSNPNDYVLHNSIRRAGSDVIYITEEDYIRPGCRGAGSFETWRVDLPAPGDGTGGDGPGPGKGKGGGNAGGNGKGKKGGDPGDGAAAETGDPAVVTFLDSWETELLADVAQPAAVCSAHYFDEADGLIAHAWYQQGVRFLDVSDPANIRQIGYYIPPAALAWSAYFHPDDPRIVYVVDLAHGITVLRLDGPLAGEAPTVTAPIRAEWLLTDAGLAAAADPTWGTMCLLPGVLAGRG
jgi:hypothetical protein